MSKSTVSLLLKATVVAAVWCVSVLWCDIQGAAFVAGKGSVLHIVFFTNFLGAIFTALGCVLFGFGSLRSLQLLIVELFEDPALRRSVTVVSCINVLATTLMYSSFTFAGMAHVYAVKTTEPLIMCLLSTKCVQKWIKEILIQNSSMKGALDDRESFSVPDKVITWETWASVFFVCIGSCMTSASLKRGGNMPITLPVMVFTYFLVFLSNCALALRTMLMKPLLHAMTRDDGVFVSCAVHTSMCTLSALLFGAPAIVSLVRHISQYDENTWKQVSTIGVSHGAYQVCNGLVLFYFTPVTYSILKQFRVIFIFFCSVYYFRKEFESVSQLTVGMFLLSAGSFCYAIR